MPRVVVLGTGTHVGKTHVTHALALALRDLLPDAAVAALKPIESGFSTESESDAALLASVARGVRLPAPHPWLGLADPVSPHLAARRAGVGPIRLPDVVQWFTTWEDDSARSAMSRHAVPHSLWSIIETAGACFSPLSVDCTNFDLALALEPAQWVLVAPDSLGVLHDVRVTWEACARRGRVPDHLVLSAARPSDASTGSNLEELRTLGIAHALQNVRRGSRDVSALARAVFERSARP